MAKFSGTASNPVRTAATGPLQTTNERVPTYEGGTGYAKTPEMELFQLAVTNMVGEDTFYESAGMRDARFENLIHEVTKRNPKFIAGDPGVEGKIGFAMFLRNTMNMRSASLVMAAEYVKAGGPNGRQVVASVLQRADEPAEMIGYWLGRHGRSMPQPIKRGIADSATRLYNEYSLLKYDGQSRSVRFGDVIELVHPTPSAPWQSELFKVAIDRRHNRESEFVLLSKMADDAILNRLPEKDRRASLRRGEPQSAGWSWERLSGWLPGGMDAEAWESLIPNMGYMALIRNLRNFEGAGISPTVARTINDRIADPDQVAKSRQFPYRFWSAYKANNSLTFASALEQALDLSTQNIPELPGRTLVLIDTSGSMQNTVSGKSQVMRYEIGALFAAAVAKKAHNADVVIYGDTSARLDLLSNESVLRYIDRVGQSIGTVGHGTMAWSAIGQHYSGHDRVVVFTDEQTGDSDSSGWYGRNHDSGHTRQSLNIPMLHTFNLAGYSTAMAEAGSNGKYAYGGFSDATFTLMKLVESGKSADWPF